MRPSAQQHKHPSAPSPAVDKHPTLLQPHKAPVHSTDKTHIHLRALDNYPSNFIQQSHYFHINNLESDSNNKAAS